MSSRAEALAGMAVVLFALVLVGLVVAPSESEEPRAALRICADPDDLPYSDAAGSGFENRLAELIAGELSREIDYVWLRQRPTAETTCDIVMGVPAGSESARTTVPYYRSTWVFVYRGDRDLGIENLNDPALPDLRIGVETGGPAAAALERRGMIENVVTYAIPADSGQDTPERLIDAVARDEIDVAIAWGPAAGYFASRRNVELKVVPVSPRVEPPLPSFVRDISMAVHRDDEPLRAALDRVIRTRAADIRKILQEFGVPLVSPRGSSLR